jgi:hypothetical protein
MKNRSASTERSANFSIKFCRFSDAELDVIFLVNSLSASLSDSDQMSCFASDK